MRISDWSSDVCSSDLLGQGFGGNVAAGHARAAGRNDAVNLRIVDPAVEPGDDLFLVVLFQIAGSKDVTCALYLFDQNVPGTVFGQCPAVRHGQHSYANRGDRQSTRVNSSH